MKRKLIACSILAICLCICCGGTLAYFSTTDTARNVITAGNIGIQIVEKMKVGDTELDFPQKGISGVMPGTTVSKIVSVANTGDGEAWIRVKVETSLLNADGAPLSGKIKTAKGTTVPALSFAVEDGWVLGEDGYYYYTSSVPAGKSTGVLFREVGFAREMNNDYQNCTANIQIYAQAVQTIHNPIPENGTVEDIPGWPD